jgi:hypothetical protein
MPTKSKKKANEMTTHEALHRLFGKHGAKHLRNIAEQELPASKPRKSLKNKA